MKAIKGNLTQCVTDFAKKTGLGKFQSGGDLTRQEAGERRKALADLFDINAVTLHGWLSAENVPTGERLIRLVVLLEAAGYEVTHHENGNYSDHQKNLMAVIAFSVVTPDELAKHAGFTSYQGLYDYVFGRNGISAEKKDAIDSVIDGDMTRGVQDMLAKRKSEIEEITKVVLQKSATSASPSSAHSSGSTQAPQVQHAEVTPLPAGSGDHVACLASLVMGAVPLAMALLQDKSPAGEKCRNRLRELTRTAGGSNGVFDLSNLLNALCSEKARTAATPH